MFAGCCAGVAQLVEQLICNQQVGGSNPSTSSNFIQDMGDFPSGQRGQTVNLLAMPSVVRIHHPPPKIDKARKGFVDFYFCRLPFRRPFPSAAPPFAGALFFLLFFPHYYKFLGSSPTISQDLCNVNTIFTSFLYFPVDKNKKVSYTEPKNVEESRKLSGGRTMGFGEQLRRRRKELGYSREELAKKLGVTASAVGRACPASRSGAMS